MHRVEAGLERHECVSRRFVARSYTYLLTHFAVYSFIERASALEGLRQRRMYTFNYLDSKTIHLSGDFDFFLGGGGPLSTVLLPCSWVDM